MVNARDGVVELRGEVERPEDVEALGAAAEKVTGVRDVNNLLHTPRLRAGDVAGQRSGRGSRARRSGLAARAGR